MFVRLVSTRGHQTSGQSVKDLRRTEVLARIAVLAFIRGNPTSGPSEGDRIQARVIVSVDRNQRRNAFFVNPSHVLPEEVEALVESELLPILTYREAQRDEHT